MSTMIAPTPDNPGAITLVVSTLSINSALAAGWSAPSVTGGALQAPTLSFTAPNAATVHAEVRGDAGPGAPVSFAGELSVLRCRAEDLGKASPALAALAARVYGASANNLEYAVVGVLPDAPQSAEIRSALLTFKGDLLPLALVGLQTGGALALADLNVSVVTDSVDSRATNLVFYGNLGAGTASLRSQTHALLDVTWLDGAVAMVAGRVFLPTQALVAATLKPTLDRLLGVSGVTTPDGLAYTAASSSKRSQAGVVSGNTLTVAQSWSLRLLADPDADTFTVTGQIEASASSDAKALFNLATLGNTTYTASAAISGKVRVLLQDSGQPSLSFVGPESPVGAVTTRSSDSGIDEASWSKALATYGFGAGTPDQALSSLSGSAEARIAQALGAALGALNTPMSGLRVVPPGIGLFAMSDPVFTKPGTFCSINLNFLAM